MATQPRLPEYRLVRRESDLEALVPGDRIKVSIDDTEVWMVYKGIDHGDGKSSLNPHSRIFLVDTPLGYRGETNVAFRIFDSAVRYLQFGGTVHFDSFHVNSGHVFPGTEEHFQVKSLMDIL